MTINQEKRARRRRRSASFILVCGTSLVAAAATGACSSDPPIAPATADAADDAVAVAEAGRDPNANCVKPGTPNNEQGAGGYCEGPADCVRGTSFCTATFAAPDDAWFCSKLCETNADCGSNMYCAHDARGVACVPIACGYTDADAPRDAAEEDAPADQ
jgi:hypothetical protein